MDATHIYSGQQTELTKLAKEVARGKQRERFALNPCFYWEVKNDLF
jgi:hypothetical protein